MALARDQPVSKQLMTTIPTMQSVAARQTVAMFTWIFFPGDLASQNKQLEIDKLKQIIVLRTFYIKTFWTSLFCEGFRQWGYRFQGHT